MSLESQARAMARRYGIPEGVFLGLIKAESSWNPNAVSRVGALGLTQVMPNTARGMGYDPKQLKNNPQMQLEAGAKYLSQMYKQFGKWDIALAAYNAGPGNVQKHGGIPPFKETQAYVPKVLKFAKDYGHSGGTGATAGATGKPAMQEITLLPQSLEFPGYSGYQPAPAPTMKISDLLAGMEPMMNLTKPAPAAKNPLIPQPELFSQIASQAQQQGAQNQQTEVPPGLRQLVQGMPVMGIGKAASRQTPQEQESLQSLPEQVRAMNLRDAWQRWTGGMGVGKR